MTRGNQRDTDRQRAAARNDKEKGGKSNLKTKESDAEIMRRKQLAALEKKQKEEEDQIKKQKKEIVQKQGHKYVAEVDAEEDKVQEQPEEIELVKKIGDDI